MRKLICIICPRGCNLAADMQGEKITVTGHSCPRGERYAIDECLHPMRSVTTALRIANRDNTMISVKTEMPVPKEKMMETVKALRALTVNAPIEVGDVVCESVYGTRILATKTVL